MFIWNTLSSQASFPIWRYISWMVYLDPAYQPAARISYIRFFTAVHIYEFHVFKIIIGGTCFLSRNYAIWRWFLSLLTRLNMKYIWGYLPALFRLDFGILWIKTL